MINRIDMSHGKGWIYILMTSSDYDRVKIGKTKNHPMLRLRNLKTGDPFLSIQVTYFVPPNFSLTLKGLEDLIHNDLKGCRVPFLNDEDLKNKPSEWFEIYCREAEGIVDNVLMSNGFKITNDKLHLENVGNNTVIKHYEDELEYEPCLFALSLVDDDWSDS
ncbi:TPA: GIY-YIG nuclease family protein [Vibrio parahaemolyticus]|nr:GIY-YIG nuclease family protein [Vibrio parahaemolyticus]